MLKWIGAALVIGSCGGCGISMSISQMREERCLRSLRDITAFLRWDLEYRLTPLSDLMFTALKKAPGNLKPVFRQFSENINMHTFPDVACCMESALHSETKLPDSCRRVLLLLGQSLGRFDLPGQLKDLDGVMERCDMEISHLSEGKEQRLRSQRILGFCAGTALAVLLV